MQCDLFTLKHFAGNVTYDVTGFLEKNNDSLQVSERGGVGERIGNNWLFWGSEDNFWGRRKFTAIPV